MRYQQRRRVHFWIQNLAKTTQPSHTKQPNLDHRTNLRVINRLFCSPDSFMRNQENDMTPTQLNSNQTKSNQSIITVCTTTDLKFGHTRISWGGICADFDAIPRCTTDDQLILKKFNLAPNLWCVARSSISFYCCRHVASPRSESFWNLDGDRHISFI